MKVPILIVATDREKRERKESVGGEKSEKEGDMSEREKERDACAEEMEGQTLAKKLGCKYTEVSTDEYKGFRTLANTGLQAILESKKMPKPKKAPLPAAASSSSIHPSKDRKEKDQCVVM